MKKIMFFVMVIIVMFVCTDTALAKRKATIEDGDLVVREVRTREIVRIPGVPEELWDKPNIADKLSSGKLKGAIIEDKVGKKTYSFDLPSIKKRIKYSDRVVRYNNGEWPMNPAASRFTEHSDHELAILWLWIVALIVVVVSVLHSLSEISMVKKIHIFWFYAALFPSVMVGELAGELVGSFAGVAICSLTVLFAKIGGTTIKYAACAFLSIFIGALVGGITGRIASVQNYEVIVHYYFFLLAVCAISFVIAWLVDFVKTLVETSNIFSTFD
ncbi:MAG: hypothetical protein V1711_00155 [bacterium]